MKRVTEILLLIFVLVILFTSHIYIASHYIRHNVYKGLNKIDLANVNNLMIVAHPDDETIWGGSHLLDEDYLVVCITCGRNIIRTHEIENSLRYSNDRMIGLYYPDKKKGKKYNWIKEKDDIYTDLKRIITYKKWNKIVTHNQNGEYGHIQHKATNEIVTKIYNDFEINTDLYFFGRYYTKNALSSLEEQLPEISMENYNIKVNKMIQEYKSQGFINQMFSHMFKYENWTLYDPSNSNSN